MKQLFWRALERFVLGIELPLLFTLALAGIPFALVNGRPLFALWLAAAATWTVALWSILWWPLLPNALPNSLPGHEVRPERDERQQHHGHHNHQ